MRQYSVIVVVQVPKKGFSDINDPRYRVGPLEPVTVLGQTWLV